MGGKASCAPQTAKEKPGSGAVQSPQINTVPFVCLFTQSSKIITTMVLLMNILYLNHSHQQTAFQHFAKNAKILTSQ